jgi:dethiobiotin synthetase
MLAASPLVASQLTREPPPNIELALQVLQSLAKKHDFLIVEGIGGIMVPLTENDSIADFARMVGLPVVIISSPLIGTLNHTLLTVMACKQFGLTVKGIIVNKMPKKASPVEQKAPEVIEKLASVKVLGILPYSRYTNHTAFGKMLEKAIDIEELLSI